MPQVGHRPRTRHAWATMTRRPLVRMTRSMAQPGGDEHRIIRLVNQPVPSPSPRPFHAKCGRTAKPTEDQFRARLLTSSHSLLLWSWLILPISQDQSQPVRLIRFPGICRNVWFTATLHSPCGIDRLELKVTIMTNRSIQCFILAFALATTIAGSASAQSSGTSNHTTAGAPAGDSSTGNGTTGSGAAPSGKN